MELPCPREEKRIRQREQLGRDADALAALREAHRELNDDTDDNPTVGGTHPSDLGDYDMAVFYRGFLGALSAALLGGGTGDTISSSAAAVDSNWSLPPIDNSTPPVLAPTLDFAVRALDVIVWPGDNRTYVYTDVVAYDNPACPGSFGSDIGVYSSADGAANWTYHGLVVRKNSSSADAGGVATPSALARDDGTVFVYFAAEACSDESCGDGNGPRGIGMARADHPLGPFERDLPPVAAAPPDWRRPAGPGGIFDDSQTVAYDGLFHLFFARKLTNDTAGCGVVNGTGRCVEWARSTDAQAWDRLGILPLTVPDMSETMFARVYSDAGAPARLVLGTDGHGMAAFVADAALLSTASDASELVFTPATPDYDILDYAGLPANYYNAAMKVMPRDGAPRRVFIDWRRDGGPAQNMTFAVLPLLPGV